MRRTSVNHAIHLLNLYFNFRPLFELDHLINERIDHLNVDREARKIILLWKFLGQKLRKNLALPLVAKNINTMHEWHNMQFSCCTL